jgi:hypothetical protein
MKIQLLSTKKGMTSSSLKRLASALSVAVGYKVWRTTKPRHNRSQLGYGFGIDKLSQYKWFKESGLSALEYTTNKEEATLWCQEEYHVFGRMLLNASCGNGIVVFDANNLPTHCPVYTKYKKKKREFRVHVFKNKVVAIVEKRMRDGWSGPRDAKIRNMKNGYVFCQEIALTEVLQERIIALAIAASVVGQGLFKGVDLGYNEKLDDLFIIEVNGAPGIEGSNISRYVAAIQQLIY